MASPLLVLSSCSPAGSPAPLFDHPRDLTTFSGARPITACVARYLADDLPAIADEIVASAKIYGAYIGREVDVRVTFTDLPRTHPASSAELARRYSEACGPSFDFVIGYAPLTTETLGETGLLPSGVRWIFLRDFSHREYAPSHVPYTWITVAQYEKRAALAHADLLARLLARDTVQFHRGNTLSSMTLLLHEMGHAWGLCDAYIPPQSDCFPVGNVRDARMRSIMDADDRRQQLFLSDDDVAAIQAHAGRTGAAVQPVHIDGVPMVSLDRADRIGGALEVRGGWVATRPARATLYARRPGAREGSPIWASETAVGEHFRETWSVPSIKGPVKLVLVVRSTDGDGSQREASLDLD